jgi:hypothetical protein
MRVRLRCLIFVVWLVVVAGPATAAATVVVLASEHSAAYIEAGEALIGELEKKGVTRQEVLRITASEWSEAGPLNPKLFIALGVQATELLARAKLGSPVLATLLPRASFERILGANMLMPSSQFSALYLDQPLSRQLQLIRLALPGTHRVGVLWGPESKAQAAALNALVRTKHLQLVESDVGPQDPLFPGLKRVLEQADLLLALPDSQVYSSGSIQNILLASFRARVPMLAYSPSYVRAGALLALYVTPAQLGVQAAGLAFGVLQGKTLPETALYSSDFQISVNDNVARALGLALDAETLQQRLLRSEAAP